MTRIINILFILSILATTIAFADPVLLFTDLTAAPNNGWDSNQPTKGAVVSIWGVDLGDRRGNSFVTVNGHNLESDSDYLEAWGEFGRPTPFLQKIVFQLNTDVPTGAGSITVTTNGRQSNPLDFIVNNGRIFFTDPSATSEGTGSIEDPWSSPRSFLAGVQPGDILYFREGVYDQRYADGKSTIWIRESRPSGTSDAPIALIGYPGEESVIDSLSNGSSNFKQGFKIEPDYYTVANLKFISHSNGIEVANYSRVIGNDVSGGAVLVDGTGIIVLRRNGSKALGNAVHGGRSGNRLDHGIYISGCAAIEGNHVGWNHIYDNSFDRGPLIVVNHQGNRCSSDVFVKSHHIYNNFVDCSQYPSRGIGLYDLSWDGGSETEPEPTYVYGNVVLSCGVEDGNYDHPAVYQSSAHGIWYNNSIIDTRTRGAVLGGELSSEFVNNIVTLRSPDYDYVNENPIVSIDNNIFYGAGTPAESTTNSYHVDPGFNINLTTLQASLDSTSPARNRGITPLSFHQFDIHGNDRVIGERIDIGAVEFYLDLAPPSPPVLTSRLLNILSVN